MECITNETERDASISNYMLLPVFDSHRQTRIKKIKKKKQFQNDSTFYLIDSFMNETYIFAEVYDWFFYINIF